MEDTTSTRRSSGVGDHDVCNPCSFLRKAVSAMLKCLGFDEAKPYVDDHGNKSSSCSKEKDEEKFNNERNGCSGQDDQSSYSPLDPRSSMDPADDPPMVRDLLVSFFHFLSYHFLLLFNFWPIYFLLADGVPCLFPFLFCVECDVKFD